MKQILLLIALTWINYSLYCQTFSSGHFKWSAFDSGTKKFVVKTDADISITLKFSKDKFNINFKAPVQNRNLEYQLNGPSEKKLNKDGNTVETFKLRVKGVGAGAGVCFITYLKDGAIKNILLWEKHTLGEFTLIKKVSN